MHKLLEKVEKELHNIAEKGISSANLDTTYKLIDIYKDIKELTPEDTLQIIMESDDKEEIAFFLLF